MKSDEYYKNQILDLVVGLDRGMSHLGLDLPKVTSKELFMIGLATASGREEVIAAKDVPDYIAEAVLRRAAEVGLLVGANEQDLMDHKTDATINLSLIRQMIDECGNEGSGDTFIKIRELMINDWPLLQTIRDSESGKGPKLKFELIRLDEKPPEYRN